VLEIVSKHKDQTAKHKTMNTLARKPRAHETKAATVTIPEDVTKNAGLFLTCNEVKNENDRLAKKFRKDAYLAMKNAGLKTINTPVKVGGEVKLNKDGVHYQVGGTEQIATIEVAVPKNSKVNLERLFAAIKNDVPTLLKIASATQKAVKEHVSESVLKQCLDETDGDEDVYIELASGKAKKK
jgi:hypothetical protein